MPLFPKFTYEIEKKMNSTMLVKKLILTVAAIGAFGMSSAFAATTYAGSWQVDQGPNWTTAPTAYTGQSAAALLFGGIASDYVISTVDASVSSINHLAWVSTYGGACGFAYPCGTQVAENFSQSTGGQYANSGDTSAYVWDWAIGSQYVNYAFRVTAVPEPETYAMLLAGLGLVGFVARRRKQA